MKLALQPTRAEFFARIYAELSLKKPPVRVSVSGRVRDVACAILIARRSLYNIQSHNERRQGFFGNSCGKLGNTMRFRKWGTSPSTPSVVPFLINTPHKLTHVTRCPNLADRCIIGLCYKIDSILTGPY